ncbi:MAG: VWA domain-containing protein [Pseudomonas sp.]|uniref:VWA domain-containing protein n=1 Tax=Pseudomonas sp. TaxID=306 RepID=UPI00339A48A4
MATLWPHWLRPFWLLLLPLLLWLLWRLWHRQRLAGRWQALIPPAFHAALLSGGDRRGSRLPGVLLGLAWSLALLALLGPSWQRVEQPNLKPASPLVVLLELTPQMLADDVPPTRLEQAKRKLLDLLEARRDAQTAVVVFAGSAHTLVPLSDDLATTRNLLDALSPSIMPDPGHRADLAVAKALALLDQGAQGQGQLLLIGSSLDEQERQGIRQALGGQGERLRMLGIGTAEGAPIPQEKGGFLKDANGAILLPRLDSSGLRAFAEDLGGHYQRARLDDSDLRRLDLLGLPQAMREEGEPTHLLAWADQGHWLLLPLLLLAACAGRRGWLLCLPLLWLMPQPSYALEFADLWLRPDQQGQRLLQAQRPAEAAQRFEDPQWQGQALYQAGDYASAAERFARGDSAADHYNRGNALAKANALEAALDAYEQALERQPDLDPALKNKALVEAALRQKQQQEQQQQQQPPEQQPQEQQGQDKPQQQQPQSGQGQANPQPGNEPQGQPKADDAATGQQQPSAARPGDPGPDKTPAGPGNTPPATTDSQPGKPGEPTSEPAPSTTGTSGTEGAAPGSEPGSPDVATGETLPADGERRQALEQWLRQIPDDPGELLRRKFWYEQQQRQEQNR